MKVFLFLLSAVIAAQARYQQSTQGPSEPNPKGGKGGPSPPSLGFCEMRLDNDYELGCSNNYVTCAGGERIDRSCSDPELRYDAVSKSCQLPQYVNSCGGSSTTTTTVLPRPSAPVDFDCTGYEDGNYGKMTYRSGNGKGGKGTWSYACANSYFICSGGIAYAENCPSMDLFFDELSDSCLEKQYVEACGGTPTTTVEPEIIPLNPEALGVDCSALKDGIYPAAVGQQVQVNAYGKGGPQGVCSDLFVRCSGGIAYPDRCAAPGTRYDVKSNMCMDPDFVEACGGTPTTTPQLQPSSTEDPNFDCRGKPDGQYPYPAGSSGKGGKGNYGSQGSACLNAYVSCDYGRATKQYCALPYLRYDAESNSCLEREYVVACGGQSTPRPELPDNEAEKPDLGISCTRRGNFPDARPGYECSPFYGSCSGVGALAVSMVCPGKTRYDPDIDGCEHAAVIRICGGNPRPTNPPQTKGPYQTRPTQMPTLPSEEPTFPTKRPGYQTRSTQGPMQPTIPQRTTQRPVKTRPTRPSQPSSKRPGYQTRQTQMPTLPSQEPSTKRPVYQTRPTQRPLQPTIPQQTTQGPIKTRPTRPSQPSSKRPGYKTRPTQMPTLPSEEPSTKRPMYRPRPTQGPMEPQETQGPQNPSIPTRPPVQTQTPQNTKRPVILPQIDNEPEFVANVGITCNGLGLFPDNRPGMACSPYFAACVDGLTTPVFTVKCQGWLKFDKERDSCRPPPLVAACRTEFAKRLQGQQNPVIPGIPKFPQRFQ